MDSKSVEVATDRLIALAFLGLAGLAAVSWFGVPQYEPTVTAAVDGFKTVLTAAMAARFGMAVPKSH